MDFGAEMLRITRDHAEIAKAGIEAGRRIAEGDKDAALRAIIAAYDSIKEKEGTKIPTMLMCAIEIGRSKL